MRVLIAEDETELARGLKFLLEKNKFTVDVARTNRPVLTHHFIAVTVKLHISEGQAKFCISLISPRKRLHSGDKLRACKGFREIIIFGKN